MSCFSVSDKHPLCFNRSTLEPTQAMATKPKRQSIYVAPCDICGDIGFEECIVRCCLCQISRQHVYCKRDNSLVIPDIWYCEECCSSDQLVKSNPKEHTPDDLETNSILIVIRENKEHSSDKEEEPTDTRNVASLNGNVKQGTNEVNWTKPPCNLAKKAEQPTNEALSYPTASAAKTAVSSSSSNMAEQKTNESQPPSSLIEEPPKQAVCLSKKAEQPVDGVLCPSMLATKPQYFLRCSSKKAVQATNKASCPSCLAAKPPLLPRHSRKKLSGDKQRRNGQSHTSHVLELPALYNVHHFEKFPSNRPKLEAVWNGSFEIQDMVFPGKLHGCFRAHPSIRPIIRVCKISEQMPQQLQFKLLPRSSIWDQIFQSNFATGNDISLYFFPLNFERSIKQYDYLLGFMEEKDLTMRSTCMEGVELLVFTSKQLCYEKELNWISFLWGAFRIMTNEHAAASTSKYEISEAHPQYFDVAVTAKQQYFPMAEIKRLSDFDVPPGFPGKKATKAAYESILQNSSSDLVEIPVRSHPALFHGVATAIPSAKAACLRTLLGKRIESPSHGSQFLQISKRSQHETLSTVPILLNIV